MWLVGPLVVALCLAYCLDYPVEKIQKIFHLGRHAAAIIVMVIFCSLAVTTTVLIVPKMVKQGAEFYNTIVSFGLEATSTQKALDLSQVASDNFSTTLDENSEYQVASAGGSLPHLSGATRSSEEPSDNFESLSNFGDPSNLEEPKEENVADIPYKESTTALNENSFTPLKLDEISNSDDPNVAKIHHKADHSNEPNAVFSIPDDIGNNASIKLSDGTTLNGSNLSYNNVSLAPDTGSLLTQDKNSDKNGTASTNQSESNYGIDSSKSQSSSTVTRFSPLGFASPLGPNYASGVSQIPGDASGHLNGSLTHGFVARVEQNLESREPTFTLSVADFDRNIAHELHHLVISLPEPLPSMLSLETLEDSVRQTRIAGTNKIADLMRTQLAPSVVNAFTWLVYLIIVPIFTFLMLYNKRVLQMRVARFILPSNQKVMKDFWPSLHHQISGYIRGKLIHVIIIAIANSLAFVVMGVNYALLLGVGVGLSVIIPYVGAVIIAVPVLIVSIFQFGFGTELWWVLIIYTFIQLLDSNVLTPMLFSKAMNLDAFSILAAILIFGGLWGFWGVFFAIPLATFIKTLITRWPSLDRNNPQHDYEFNFQRIAFQEIAFRRDLNDAHIIEATEVQDNDANSANGTNGANGAKSDAKKAPSDNTKPKDEGTKESEQKQTTDTKQNSAAQQAHAYKQEQGSQEPNAAVQSTSAEAPAAADKPPTAVDKEAADRTAAKAKNAEDVGLDSAQL